MRTLAWFLALLLLLASAGWLVFLRESNTLPGGLVGSLVYVSDRSGAEALYLRHFPDGEERLLASTDEPAREPALSPDGSQVACALNGQIALVSVASGGVRAVTNGVEWRDASPAWTPDGKALLVASRRPGATNADIHRLELDPEAPEAPRIPLTETPGLDEATPAASPDGSFVVFVREDALFRLDLTDRRTRKLTTGFRKTRHPRFLPSGRILFLWSQEKQFGLDVIDAHGRNREALWQGSAYYRTAVPSPDGRFLAATFTYDLRFLLMDALKLRNTEEVRLLDMQGRPLAMLARSRRHSNHSPDWGR